MNKIYLFMCFICFINTSSAKRPQIVAWEKVYSGFIVRGNLYCRDKKNKQVAIMMKERDTILDDEINISIDIGERQNGNQPFVLLAVDYEEFGEPLEVYLKIWHDCNSEKELKEKVVELGTYKDLKMITQIHVNTINLEE